MAQMDEKVEASIVRRVGFCTSKMTPPGIKYGNMSGAKGIVPK